MNKFPFKILSFLFSLQVLPIDILQSQSDQKIYLNKTSVGLSKLLGLFAHYLISSVELAFEAKVTQILSKLTKKLNLIQN